MRKEGEEGRRLGKNENAQLGSNGDKYSYKPQFLGTVWLANLTMNCCKTRTQRMHMPAIVSQTETVVVCKNT